MPAEPVPGTACGEQQHREGEGVGVDDPLQAGPPAWRRAASVGIATLTMVVSTTVISMDRHRTASISQR